MSIIKKFSGSLIPFLFFHLLCCGALLFFLISSGYLLVLYKEGVNKTFLLPILGLGALFVWLHHQYNKSCHVQGYKTIGDHAFSILLYITFSFIFGIAFMIYVFIPWWIPGYQGGPLLP